MFSSELCISKVPEINVRVFPEVLEHISLRSLRPVLEGVRRKLWGSYQRRGPAVALTHTLQKNKTELWTGLTSYFLTCFGVFK